MRKNYFLGVLLLVSILLLLYKKCDGKTKQGISIVYDKTYVKPLKGFEGYKDVTFKQIGEIKNPNAVFFHCWDTDPGDFKRIRLKPKSGKTIDYDNIDGWVDIYKREEGRQGSVLDGIKTPEQSKKIKKHPYGITLAMEGEDQLLMLFGYHYSSDPAGLLTLIYVGRNNAEVVFNKRFKLFDLRESEAGYSLIGRIGSEGSYSDSYEISIKDGKLSMEKLPLQKVYESQDPHIILYDAIGYGYNKQPGDFTRLELPERQADISKDILGQVVNVVPYDVWTLMPAGIKLPTQTTTIKRTPYFIILGNEGSKIALLSRRDCAESKATILTILRLLPFYPISLYNNYFSLKEILEDDKAYHLLGTRKNAKDPNKVYEITIDKSTMDKDLSWW